MKPYEFRAGKTVSYVNTNTERTRGYKTKANTQNVLQISDLRREVYSWTMDGAGALSEYVTGTTAVMKLQNMLFECVETGSLKSNIAVVIRQIDKQCYLCGLE